MPTTTLHCGCRNEIQDKEHGRGIRVFNSTRDDKWRCTVCLKEVEGAKQHLLNDK